MDDVSFQPSNQEPEVEFPPVDATPVLSEPVATVRASKAQLGLKDKIDLDYDNLKRSIQQGRENQVRSQVASQLDIQRAADKQDRIVKRANLQGGTLTPEDISDIDNQMSRDDLFNGKIDPKSVFENHYAKEYIKSLNWPMGEEGPHWYKDAVAEIPQQVEDLSKEAVSYVQQREYILSRLQNIEAKLEDRTTLQSIGAFGLGLVPFREQALLRGNVPYKGIDLTTSGALEDQRRTLLSQPFDQFKQQFDAVVDHLEQHDLDTAKTFTSAMLGQTTTEAGAHGLGQLMDVSMIPAGKVSASLVRKVTLYNQMKTAFKDTALSTANVGTKSIEAAAADGAGNLQKAATINTADGIVQRIQGRANPEKEAIDAMSSVLKPISQSVRDTPGRSGQEIANRIAENMDSFGARLLDTIQNQIKVERISAVLAAREATAGIVERMRGNYVRLDNHIINQSEIYWDEFANEYRSDTHFGQYDGTYFVSRLQADAWAKQKGLSGGRIVGPGDTGYTGSGAGYYYSMAQPVKEREANWLRSTINTANTDIPNSMLQAYTGWLGWIRTPEETLSAVDNWNRKAVIYGQSLLKNLYKEKADSLNKLYYGPGMVNRLTAGGRKRADEFLRTINAAVDHWDPAVAAGDRTPMNKGYWFKNPQELEEFYQTNWNRMPDPIEVKAYFDVVQMHDMDWVVRNLEIHKKMSMEGAMEFRVTAMRNASDRHFSDFFPAIKKGVLPSGDEIIAVIGANHGDERVITANKFSAKTRAETNDMLKTGEMQLIQVWNANHLPLSNFGGAVKSTDRVQYVLAKSGAFRERPLSFNQLPRRGGGHIDYDSKRFIKQAQILPQFAGKAGKVFQHTYVGDTTVMAHDGPEIAGKNSTKILNEAREHLRAGNEVSAMAAISKLPIPWKDFKSWFKPSAYIDAAGNKVKVPARLSLKEPFYLVDKDKRIVDMPDNDLVRRYTNQETGKSTFRDGTKEGSPAQQFNVEYSQQRDAYELTGLVDKGTRYNPLYGYGPANKIDPLTTLNRGLKRIVNSSYMDDYKSVAVGNWLEQAYKMGVFDDTKASLNQIRSAPFYFFHNANSLYKKGFDRTSGDYHKLEIARKQTLAFVGEFSPVDAWVNNIQSKLENTIYGGGLGRAAIVPYYGIPAIRTAGKYLRAAVFHSTIGMFNWVQYLVQNMTYSTILGIAGPNAAYHGWLGATLHNLGRFAGMAYGDVGNALDRIAGRMGGWKPGEWAEARNLLAKTGFDFVGGEHVMMDYMLHPKVLQNTFGRFLDAGQIFFKAGERHARYGAWFTAYKEFRNGIGPWSERGPQTGAVSNAQLLEILNRADLLSGNMTTASKSLLQKGPFEFTTQFLGYTLRLTEQMTGKRLTKTEKARLFAVNGALYGIPASMGLLGFPFTDMFRQQAIQHDYVVGEHWYNDVMMNGLPSFIGALISGGGDPSAGIYYNVGDRLGNPGIDIFREAWYGGDKSALRIITGAAGSSIIDGMYQMSGFLNTAKSFVKDGGESFPYTFNDVMDGARILYSVNHAYGGFLAWNTGIIRSKKDVPIEPTSPGNAIWQAITGLSSQQASDFQRFKYNLDTEKQMQRDALNLYSREVRRAFIAASNKDFTEAGKYFARAKGILDASNYPVNERANAFATAADDKDLIMKINWDYYMRNPPAGVEKSRIEDYIKQQQIRNKRFQ
jgi:hypothetical protein